MIDQPIPRSDGPTGKSYNITTRSFIKRMTQVGIAEGIEMESFISIMIDWKGLVLRGALAIILGLILALLPGPTLIVATILIGVFVLMLGLVAVAMFIILKEKKKGVVLLFEGALGVTFGVITIIWPNITALLLILILGIWCLMEGMVQLYTGFVMTKKTALRAVVSISGIITIMVGLIFILAPGEGALALIWLIGVFAIMYGALSVIYGMMIRSLLRKERMA